MSIQWITDRPPKHSGTVLVRIDAYGHYAVDHAFYDKGWHWANRKKIIDVSVRGWMELEDAASVLDNLPCQIKSRK